MPILDRDTRVEDSSDVDKPVDPAVVLLLESLKQTGLTKPVKQPSCQPVDVPAAHFDEAAVWFAKAGEQGDLGADAALSQEEIQILLQNPCLPAESEASLKFLDYNFSFFAKADSDPSNDKITNESITSVESWLKTSQRESDRLDVTAPGQSASVRFIHENLDWLDGNKDGELYLSEVDKAFNRPDLNESQRSSLRQLQRSFLALAEPGRIPLSIGSLLKTIIDGPMGPITATSITDFMVNKNVDNAHAYDRTLRDGILAIETLRFHRKPYVGLITGPSHSLE